METFITYIELNEVNHSYFVIIRVEYHGEASTFHQGRCFLLIFSRKGHSIKCATNSVCVLSQPFTQLASKPLLPHLTTSLPWNLKVKLFLICASVLIIKLNIWNLAIL